MNDTIAIIGLGYVGLPLAVEFGKKTRTIGFDIYKQRINELRNAYDRTMETTPSDLESAEYLEYTYKEEELRDAKIYIITVPTPIDMHKKPDLSPLRKASSTVGSVISKGDIVIYESTVFPGCTEEVCVPILEESSGLKFNEDFFCGYSPERINPGDKEHSVCDIKKVVSGSTYEIGLKIDSLYKTIIRAGTHLASSIKVAEAAKVIENSQRDLNIAFVNELAKLFNILGIDTTEVLDAAGTKWNFLPFKPGLVGGHCIGVDPYYLTYKAQEVGYHPEIILAGRRLNDNMGEYIAGEIIKLMIKKELKIFSSHILVLGITFKENCPDIRNSRVIDLISALKAYGCKVSVYDPWADAEEVCDEYGFELICEKEMKSKPEYDTVVLAVAHNQFKKLDIRSLVKENAVVYDIKSVLNKNTVDSRL